MLKKFNKIKYPQSLKSILAPGNRVAIYRSSEETNQFFEALSVFKLDALKTSIIAIIEDDPALIGQKNQDIPIVSKNAIFSYDINSILIICKKDYSPFLLLAKELKLKKSMYFGPWQWTFSGVPGQSISEKKKHTHKLEKKRNYRPNLLENPFFEVVTLEGLLTVSYDRDVDDIIESYSDPIWARDNLDRIVWISPREPHPFLGEQPVIGNYFDCNINSNHMRSDREITTPKPKNCIRVFLVGASTAFSSGAPSNNETIGSFMERAMNENIKQKEKIVEVYTAASPQWSTTHERIVIENRIARLNPDFVVSLSGAADIFWYAQGQDIFEVTTDWYQHFIFAFNQFLGMLNKPVIENYPRKNSTIELTLKNMADNLLLNIEQSAFRLKKENVPYLFALQPSLIVSKKEKSAIEKKNVQKAENNCYVPVENILNSYNLLRKAVPGCDADNLYFEDLSSVFDKCSEETYFIDAFHFGDKGNKVIGEALAERSLEILKC